MTSKNFQILPLVFTGIFIGGLTFSSDAADAAVAPETENFFIMLLLSYAFEV